MKLILQKLKFHVKRIVPTTINNLKDTFYKVQVLSTMIINK